MPKYWNFDPERGKKSNEPTQPNFLGDTKDFHFHSPSDIPLEIGFIGGRDPLPPPDKPIWEPPPHYTDPLTGETFHQFANADMCMDGRISCHYMMADHRSGGESYRRYYVRGLSTITNCTHPSYFNTYQEAYDYLTRDHMAQLIREALAPTNFFTPPYDLCCAIIDTLRAAGVQFISKRNLERLNQRVRSLAPPEPPKIPEREQECPKCHTKGTFRHTLMGCAGIDMNHVTCLATTCDCPIEAKRNETCTHACGWRGRAYMIDGTHPSLWPDNQDLMARDASQLVPLLRLIFGAPPSHDGTHFIECENQLQESRKLGEWNPVDYSKPDGLWELAFTQAEVEQFFREENQRILDLNTARHFAQLEAKTKADAAYPEFLESEASGSGG